VLLIIDEAHKLSQELFEEIRLLSNIEMQSTKLVNIFFVGQNEIHDLLEKEESRALRQRITLIYNMKPFTAEETRQYIRHRLRIAGTEQNLFTEKAVRRIHQFSKGYARLINTLCDRALLTGYTKELAQITPGIIKECVEELRLPGESRKGQYQKRKLSKKRTKTTQKGVIVLTSFLLAVILLSGFLVIAAQDGSYLVNLMLSYGKGVERSEAVVSQNGPSNSQDPNSQQAPAVSPFARQIKQEPPVESVSVAPTNSQDLNSQQAPDVSPIARKVEQEPPVESVSEVSKEVVESQNGPVLDSTGKNKQAPPIKYLKVIVRFSHDDVEISKESRKVLDDFVERVGQNKNVKITVKGYTNGLGNPDYNKRLSGFRANVVKSYLVAKGIREDIIASIGMGEESPLKPYGTLEGRIANRRVEVELIPPKN
jgi:general secretion pathway protein A